MIIETMIFSIASLIVLFVLTRLMGYRQITQLSMYDYIIGITIGSIAAEMVVLSNYQDMIRPIVGMIMYALFTILLSILSRDSIRLRHWIEGNPIVLYENDKIQAQSLKKSRIDINEFLMQLRIQGYFDLTQLDKVILETNGNLSVFVKTAYRPIQLSDIKKDFSTEKPLYSLIINGHILDKQLQCIKQDKKWLYSKLQVLGYHEHSSDPACSL